jgi:hypothetical protein
MSAMSEAKEILGRFGDKLAEDLEKSLVRALREGGSKNVQQPKLNFRSEDYIEGDGVTMEVIASGEYWKWIESGRKKGARRIPADVVGKKWQNLNGIDPRSIILQMRAKKKRGLSINKTKLNYDKAAKSLSFVIQNSIFKKGIKPKPFVDRVLEDGRIEMLSAELRQVLGKNYRLEIITELQ